MPRLLFLYGCIILFSGCNPVSPDGVYIGFEEWSSIVNGAGSEYEDPAGPSRKRYYLYKLRIRSDSAFLDQSTISISNGDTSYSASDGGFYYYSGKVSRNGKVLHIRLGELFCDYCPVEVRQMPDGTSAEVKRSKLWTAKIIPLGLEINGHVFRRSTAGEKLISERPGALQ